MRLIDHLYNIRKALESNYNFFLRLIFTISVYVLHRVFVMAIGYDNISTLNLVFIIAGFAVFSLDRLLRPVFWFFEMIFSKFSGNKAKWLFALTSIAFLLSSFIAMILYYASGILFWSGISIISLCSSVLSAGFLHCYTSLPGTHYFRMGIVVLILYGFFAAFQSAISNDPANLHVVTYIVIFILFVILSERWKQKSDSVE